MNLLKKSSGQALIELIIFLPLIVTLYSVIAGFANSINGSINQQKIARSYFYNRIQNNSTIPNPRTLNNTYVNWSIFSVYYIGWKDYFKGEGFPVMPCYRVNIPLKDKVKDNCEDAYSEKSTLWIRVGTVYGICGASFLHSNGKVYYLPDFPGINFTSVVDKSSCIISQ
jgi:hypothetical protein